MILFQDNRFQTDGVSFTIPDGFYLNTATDIMYESGIEVFTPDERYTVLILSTDIDEEDSESELESMFERETWYTVLREVSPVRKNGLSGHDVVYKDNNYCYYEAIFDLEDEEEEYEHNAFTIRVSGQYQDGADIEKFMKTAEFKKVMSCFSTEK